MEHILAHCAVKFVLERFIFKIKFNVIVFSTVTHSDIKENFDGAFGDWPKFVRLTEFNIVPISKLSR